MVTEVNAVTLRQNPGEKLNQVQRGNESILIVEDRQPIAALDHFDRLSSRIAESYSEVPPEPGLEEIEGAVAASPVDQAVLARLRKPNTQYLITGDEDLLILADKYAIVTPAEFWARHG